MGGKSESNRTSTTLPRTEVILPRFNLGSPRFLSIIDNLGILSSRSIIAPRIWRVRPSCRIDPTPLFLPAHGSHLQYDPLLSTKAVAHFSQLIHSPCGRDHRLDDPVGVAREGPVSPRRSACQPFRNKCRTVPECQDRPAGRCRLGTRHCRRSRAVPVEAADSIQVLLNDTELLVGVPSRAPLLQPSSQSDVSQRQTPSLLSLHGRKSASHVES